jgi:homoserine kinase type II
MVFFLLANATSPASGVTADAHTIVALSCKASPVALDMAVFTQLSPEDALRVARAHGLGGVDRVHPVPAGSVNSNFFIDSGPTRLFVRIYEEQEADGVAHEWGLLEAARAAGIPAPRRRPGPGPGDLRVGGKPVAAFELVGGAPTCQAGVTPERASAVGGALARIHGLRAPPRPSRFSAADVLRRVDDIEAGGGPELLALCGELRAALDGLPSGWEEGLPTGVIHGDLFRDNVRFDGDEVVAVLDWESASDGLFVYDLMVAVLAWCFGDGFRWDLARALLVGYGAARVLGEREWAALHPAAVTAAVRFTATRLTDFELRAGIGERVHKDYRRFAARLAALRALSPSELRSRLGA